MVYILSFSKPVIPVCVNFVTLSQVSLSLWKISNIFRPSAPHIAVIIASRHLFLHKGRRFDVHFEIIYAA